MFINRHFDQQYNFTIFDFITVWDTINVSMYLCLILLNEILPHIDISFSFFLHKNKEY